MEQLLYTYGVAAGPTWVGHAQGRVDVIGRWTSSCFSFLLKV